MRLGRELMHVMDHKKELNEKLSNARHRSSLSRQVHGEAMPNIAEAFQRVQNHAPQVLTTPPNRLDRDRQIRAGVFPAHQPVDVRIEESRQLPSEIRDATRISSFLPETPARALESTAPHHDITVTFTGAHPIIYAAVQELKSRTEQRNRTAALEGNIEWFKRMLQVWLMVLLTMLVVMIGGSLSGFERHSLGTGRNDRDDHAGGEPARLGIGGSGRSVSGN